jgi:hypothetical protein
MMAGLCALSDVKSWLDIFTTAKDAKLQQFIDSISSQMITYLGYQAHRTTYTSEAHAINNNQLMYLNAAPIQSVSAVTLNGVTINPGTGDNDYQFDAIDQKAGRLYRGSGWVGNYYTRNMTYDPVSGMRQFICSYIGGWYFPDDTGYSLADAQSYNVTASLPYSISAACVQEVTTIYRRNVSKAEGLIGYSEGGISWNWSVTSMDNTNAANMAGLSSKTCAVLNAYRRYGFA